MVPTLQIPKKNGSMHWTVQKRCIDIANVLGCKNLVLWLAREGTYIRESKCASGAVGQISGCD